MKKKRSKTLSAPLLNAVRIIFLISNNGPLIAMHLKVGLNLFDDEVEAALTILSNAGLVRIKSFPTVSQTG